MVHFDYIPIDWLIGSTSWNHTRSYGPDTAIWHELGHELGLRVEDALEETEFGFGPLFDLDYAIYCDRLGA